MDRFVFNKEMYFYEIERRHKLNAALSMPVGVATILGSFLYFYAANLTFKGWDHLLNWIQPFCVCPQTKPLEWGDLHGFSFDIILFVSFLCWFIAVFFLMRAIWPGEYAYLPTPNVLEKYRQDMIAWNDGRKPPMKDKKEKIHQEVDDYILLTMINCTPLNTNTNDLKAKYSGIAIKYLVVAIFFLIILSIVHFGGILSSEGG